MDLELIGVVRPPHLAAVNFRLRSGLTLVTGPDRECQAALVRLLALRWLPSAGRMIVQGQDLSHLSPAARSAFTRKIGFAPADTALPGHVRVRTALSYIGALWQVRGQAKVDAEIERWELGPLRRRPLGSLSPGERRRFVLAASLVMTPDLWILERPFEGLDIPGRTLVRQLILSASALGDAKPRHVVLVQDEDDDHTQDLPVQVRLHACDRRIG